MIAQSSVVVETKTSSCRKGKSVVENKVIVFFFIDSQTERKPAEISTGANTQTI